LISAATAPATTSAVRAEAKYWLLVAEFVAFAARFIKRRYRFVVAANILLDRLRTARSALLIIDVNFTALAIAVFLVSIRLPQSELTANKH
jgi:hypothetical protein